MSQNTPNVPELEALLASEILDEDAISDEQVDQMLLDIGASPLVLEDNADALITQLQQGQLQWQSDARRDINRHRQLIERPPRERHIHCRQTLLDTIEEARRDPMFGQEVATYFRHRSPEEATDEELLGLLEDLETLRQLISQQDD